MRQYRARKRAEETALLGRSLVEQADALARGERETAADAIARIAELETEVKHLKAELAKRTTSAAQYASVGQGLHDAGFNSRPFTPAPKTHR